MRFIAEGPSIPDELLLARDQGRVVFFCGAGVSRAKAKLPDFFELAAMVTKHLGVQPEDPAMKIIAAAKEIGEKTTVDGLISADRIFGLLERDFLRRDIQEAVAQALKPSDDPDLDAHNTLLKLATTQEGFVRLVTTNFDRLFHTCRPELNSHIPPNLPDPSRAKEFQGVVYLHGMISPEEDGAEGDGFVLSSSEFGRAYLSDGWATAFVREILEKYYVVFVGYSADDPPVQYLLEALNSDAGSIDGVYAFQAGDHNYAYSKWKHKGVEAVAYDASNGHAALWNSLKAWAIRAENPNAWTRSVIERAKDGPEELQPHERGQVAHVVSTVEGMRKFADADNLPPATWLCVFDPNRRYEKPGQLGRMGEEGPFVDPFELYCLDTDPVPSKIDPEDFYAKREKPNGVWDAFELSKLDRIGLQDENVSSLRGIWSNTFPRLPTRQWQLGFWISKVAAQPAALWWALRQISIHPSIREQIAYKIERADADVSADVNQAWRYLFDWWSEGRSEHNRDWYELGGEIGKSGWSEIVLRRFAKNARPFLKAEKPFWNGPIPNFSEDIGLGELIHLKVDYPDLPPNIEIPDDWLTSTIVVLRRNLELSLELEQEIGGYGLTNITPITPDEDDEGDQYSRSHGLSAWVLYFIGMVRRLCSINLQAAKAEFGKWPIDDSTIFARLRIWVLSLPELVPDCNFSSVLKELPDEAFWDSYHARDLLLTMSGRWNDLDDTSKREIEQRIVEGPKPWENEEDEHFIERKARWILNRLNWLHEKGCQLTTNVETISQELQQFAPEWKPEYAKHAAKSFEGKVGWVRTETDYSTLLKEPIKTTLSKAKELSGRQNFDELVDYDPFSGLSQARPVRAFAALRIEADRGEFPEWAWRTFLSRENRKDDPPKFTALIGEQICRYTREQLAGIVRPVSDWVKIFAERLATDYPTIFSSLISKAIGVLAEYPLVNTSTVVRGKNDIDWATESINSPVGELAESLLYDPQRIDLKQSEGLPQDWLVHVEALLSLQGDLRRHAIVIFSREVNWFFHVDPTWTRSNLMSVLEGGNDLDKDALWAGFLWRGKASGREFFLVLKPYMLSLATSGDLERRGHAETLTALLLSAWALVEEETGEKWISDDELRYVLINSDDDIRSHTLWHVEQWSMKNPEQWLPLLEQLLISVWPRQITAKSGVVSARLCDIAFSNEARFPELAQIILPLLTKSDGDHLMLPNLRKGRDNIVDLHPEQTLALLHAVLPDKVSSWPYGIDATLERIDEAENSLNTDERLIELKRKWNAR